MRLIATALLLATLPIPIGAFAQSTDADNDSVPDNADAYPCDNTASGELFAPAEGVHGTVAFEDQWPSNGDLDFNDVVVAYHYRYRLDAQGRVRSVRATYDVLALGGNLSNGLGLRLPAARGAMASATRTVGGVTTALSASPADAEVTLVISPNLRELFGNEAGRINSVTGPAPLSAVRVVVDVAFTSGVTFGAASAPHDVYVFRADTPSHEIHRPEFGGTAAMNAALFGTGADGSTAERRFVDVDGLPYALVIPTLVAYPREGVAISQLFPNIVTFASSGGTSATNFYATNVNAAVAYATVGTAGVAAATVDRSCVPANRNSCLRVLQAGESFGSGTYNIDLDGTGPDAAIDVYCDMTTDGGGFTLVEHVVNGYHATTAAVSPTQLPGRATHAKLSDAQIRMLGQGGQNEALIDGNATQGTRFIIRYSSAEWASFSSTGNTNVAYDSKASNGTWANNVCNGHYNNRGFSTYSDAHGRACPTVWSGTSRYLTTWHTANYAGGVGGVYDVLIR
jgi:LruC domain-containing protein